MDVSAGWPTALLSAAAVVHWRQFRSTKSPERLNQEVKRRSEMVGIFPNQRALLRLMRMVLAEQHDEWQGSSRDVSRVPLAALLTSDPLPALVPALAVAQGGDERVPCHVHP